MKYKDSGVKIPLPDRKNHNAECLVALNEAVPSISNEEIHNRFTGIGGLHGLNFVDYGNYYDFSEAKKVIEQGQFFTPDALCKWVLECIRPEYRHSIADLTCGKGSFFNHISCEENAFGCEIDPDSFAIARQLYPEANLTLGDIRTYKPKNHFNIVVGNPPYNLTWDYDGRKMESQVVYTLKAAELLFPGGILAIIVPEVFLGESTRKIDVKRIYQQFNHVVQLKLDANAFSWLGVTNYPTKLLILQRKADALEDVPFNPELVTLTDSNDVFSKYLRPVMDITRTVGPKIQLQWNREKYKEVEKKRIEENLLYQIHIHPRTAGQYEECKDLLHQYYTQEKPKDMDYLEWEKKRLHYKSVLKQIRSVIRLQNHVEIDKVELVKSDDRIYYKAYSKKVQPEADELNQTMAMQRITQLVASGKFCDLEKCEPYQKLLQRKQKAYRQQIVPYEEMQEDPKIRAWLESWELRDKWGENPIKLSAGSSTIPS